MPIKSDTTPDFRKLTSLYQLVPGVPCIAGCTGCCVSPNMTLIEFCYLVKNMFEVFDRDRFTALVNAPMRPHPGFEGNFYCRFQLDNGCCEVHSHRALACRLHGLPVIDNLGISNMENCSIMEKTLLPEISVDTAHAWLNTLVDLNRGKIDQYGESFHRLIGLTVECWLDILFLDDLSNTELKCLQDVIRSLVPFGKYQLNYAAHTEIREKVDTITLLELSLGLGNKDAVTASLEKIKAHFPSTGTYFLDQCEWMLQTIKN